MEFSLSGEDATGLAKTQQAQIDRPRRPAAMVSGVVVAAVAAAVIVGWLVGLPAITHIDAAYSPMSMDAAVTFLVAGIASVLLAAHQERAAVVLSTAVVVMGVVGGLANAFGLEAGFGAALVESDASFASMAPASAVCFTLVGTGTVILSSGTRGLRLVPFGWAVYSLALALSLGALVGYAAGVERPFGPFEFVGMSLHSTILFVLVGGAGMYGLARLTRFSSNPRGGLVPALGISMIGIIVSLVLAGTLQEGERRLLRQATGQALIGIKEDILGRVSSRLSALDRMGRRWVFAGGTRPEQWQDDANAYVSDDAESLQTIGWLDKEGILRRIAPFEANESAIGTKILPLDEATIAAIMQRDPGASLGRLATFQSGEKRLALIYPLVMNDQTFEGLLIASYRLADFLRPSLERTSAGTYAVQIWEDGEQRFGYQDQDDRYTAFVRNADITLGGRTWNIRVWPSSELAGTLDSWLPQAVLIVGLLVTALLATLTFVARLVRVRELQLLGTNRSLQDEVERRRDAEQRYVEQTEELKSRGYELEAVNAELEAFSYSVSHDLRAPLRAMDGYCQALAEDYAPNLDETARRYVSRVRAGSQRLSRLIDDLLVLSRVTRADMEPSEVDLSEVAADVVEELQEGAGPAVKTTIEPDLRTKGDQRLLRALLQNLIGNAWKFSRDAAQPALRVGKTTILGREAFYVRDNGVGFDMAFADKLFRPFQRLHSDSEFEGTGIGLATVARIVRRHGGEVWAESLPGNGATIYFTLPVPQSDEVENREDSAETNGEAV